MSAKRKRRKKSIYSLCISSNVLGAIQNRCYVFCYLLCVWRKIITKHYLYLYEWVCVVCLRSKIFNSTQWKRFVIFIYLKVCSNVRRAIAQEKGEPKKNYWMVHLKNEYTAAEAKKEFCCVFFCLLIIITEIISYSQSFANSNFHLFSNGEARLNDSKCKIIAVVLVCKTTWPLSQCDLQTKKTHGARLKRMERRQRQYQMCDLFEYICYRTLKIVRSLP